MNVMIEDAVVVNKKKNKKTELYNHLQIQAGKDIIKAGWKAAGISENLADARKNQKNLIKDNLLE